ncbi:dehydroascorbate reductase 2 [Artemisia annua]|uniref:glutathione transferase n=1 Tax=Artemisia annua TaxID=35608 RepID=A0A2U1MWU3_ARTAN|nr:dehydroascorbate reductase 2 [Artemisia annua]
MAFRQKLKAQISFYNKTLVRVKNSAKSSQISLLKNPLSPLYQPLVEEAGLLGTEMKDEDVACDVISFGDPYMNKRQFFYKLVRSADKDGNCNICHVPPESSLLEALSRSQIFIPRVGGESGSAQSSSLSGQHDKAIVVYVKALPSYANAPPRNADDRPFCQRVLLTLEEKKVPYNIQFMRKKPKWFFKVNPDGKLPLIRFSDATFVSNSDVIVGMIEEMHPEHPLVTPPYFAYFGLKILPKLSEFLKSKDKNSEQALLYELMELEGHLLDYGPCVNGKEITAVDLSLAPKLYHLVNASCKLTVPEDLTNVQRYIEILFNHPSFEKTKPSPEDVKEGWRQRLRMQEICLVKEKSHATKLLWMKTGTKILLQLPYISGLMFSEDEPTAEISLLKVQVAVLVTIYEISGNKKSASAFESVFKKVSGIVVGIACTGVGGLRDAAANALIGLASIDPYLIPPC